MAGDIEAFLKMAAERRRQALEAEGKAAPPPPPQQQPTAYQPQQPYRPTPSRPAPSRPAPPPPPANRPVNVPYSQPATRQSSSYRASTSTPVGGSRPKTYDQDVELVDAEVMEDDYFSGGRRSQLSHSLLSAEVSSEDISSHAEHLDDHWKNSLTDDEVEKIEKSFVDDLMKMFSDPDSITKAILVNEILRRPDFD